MQNECKLICRYACCAATCHNWSLCVGSNCLLSFSFLPTEKWKRSREELMSTKQSGSAVIPFQGLKKSVSDKCNSSFLLCISSRGKFKWSDFHFYNVYRDMDSFVSAGFHRCANIQWWPLHGCSYCNQCLSVSICIGLDRLPNRLQ